MECDSLLDSYFYVFYENKNEVEKKCKTELITPPLMPVPGQNQNFSNQMSNVVHF